MVLASTRPVVDDDDPLTDQSPGGVLWTRANAGESLPGVLTPLSWSVYGRVLELSARQGFADLGVAPKSATAYPAAIEDRLIGVFAGRCTINVGVIRNLMGGLPGITGDDIERDMLGAVRPGVVDTGYGWRLPAFLVKAPPRLLSAGRAPARCRLETARYWATMVDHRGLRAGAEPGAVLIGALERYFEAARLQSATRLLCQGAVAKVSELAERVGAPELAGPLLAGARDGEETIVSDDLWNLAHGHGGLAEFIAKHGYHGPGVGEIAAHSWREDSTPVERLLPKLLATERPVERRKRAADERTRAERTLMAALARHQRPGASLMLRIAPYAGLALERCKTSWLMLADVVRACARTLGEELAAGGDIDEPSDVFLLYAEELAELADARKRVPTGDLAQRLARRRAALATYRAVEVPLTWVGNPVLTPLAESDTHGAPISHLQGIGAGGGSASGPVRVMLHPDDDRDLQPGDILVCPTTDPSWVSLMTVAGGLVIDVGSAASHGAIVAREIGIPCVVGTRTGTRDLRNGDLVKVDGNAGRVEILSGDAPSRGRS